MANTPILYNAAYSGAMSGISSRWLTGAAAATYSTVIAACAGFATLVDARLGVLESNSSDANLLQQICGSFWEGRIPTLQLTTADVIPLCDLFLAGRSELALGAATSAFTLLVAIGEISANDIKDITVIDSRFALASVAPLEVPVKAQFIGTSAEIVLVAQCVISDYDTGEVTLTLYNWQAVPIDIEDSAVYFEVLPAVVVV
jgi:hypothetical protein